MRRPLFAAILALAPSPLLAASFNLSLDDTNGERVVVVARADGGVFAVAAGGEDLKILKGEDADRARARELAVPAIVHTGVGLSPAPLQFLAEEQTARA